MNTKMHGYYSLCLEIVAKKSPNKGLRIITSHTPIVNLVWVGKW